MDRSEVQESLLRSLNRLFSAPFDFSGVSHRLRSFLDGLSRQEPKDLARPERWDVLAGVIDQQIIPLLAKTHESSASDGATPSMPWIGPEHVNRFADLCIAGDTAAAGQYVQELAKAGYSRTSLLIDLVAPGARELGVRWTQDCCSFAEVSLGLVRIHEIVHEVGVADEAPFHISTNPGKILLSCMPGSSHILGCTIVAGFFRQCGWEARVMLPNNAEELVGVMEDESFDVVGLSVATDRQVNQLKPLVEALRAKSHNRYLSVFLGGPAFMLREHHAAEFDADAICVDPRMTVTLAEISRLAAH